MTKQNLYESVENFRKAAKLTKFQYPLDIFELCHYLKNIEIARVPFKTSDLRGMVCISDDVQKENHAILINSNKPKDEQNYHAAHELMHILLHKKDSGQSFRCFDKVKPQQDSYIEWQANEGAAELLVPYRVLLPLIKDNYDEMLKKIGTYGFCKKYSSYFGVSLVVLKNRLNALSYEIEQFINGVDISDIEILSKTQQKRQGINILSLPQQEDIQFINKYIDEESFLCPV